MQKKELDLFATLATYYIRMKDQRKQFIVLKNQLLDLMLLCSFIIKCKCFFLRLYILQHNRHVSCTELNLFVNLSQET